MTGPIKATAAPDPPGVARVCRNGHLTNRKVCRTCHNLAQRRYEKTEKGKKANRRYKSSARGKTVMRAGAWRRYHHTQNGERRRQAALDYHFRHRERRLAGMKAYGAKGVKRIQFWVRQAKETL